ncbi:MAG TPA: hypothetical protein VE130_12605 [Nitrososphaeraceae archaeon]|nr:hypothetical protein [Nitrososphaeraceae archaeon]
MKIQTRNIAIVAVAAMLLATTAISTSALPNSALAYKKNQATSQANACGNDFLPINIGCQNTDSQIQGDENSVALAAQQTFPAVEMVKPIPPIPPKFGCPADTLWDVTLDETTPDGRLDADTVLCLFAGPSGNARLGAQDVVIGGTNDEIRIEINPLGEGQSSCPTSQMLP